MRIDIVLAWPRRCEAWTVDVPEGATLGDALTQAGLDAGTLQARGVDGYALYGVRAEPDAVLHAGDRIELLRPLVVDPKQARRNRAAR
jgi:putative ubiquitin-RnfH superfamily antitoxin RatB of RatAB toxin-antitoxin module